MKVFVALLFCGAALVRHSEGEKSKLLQLLILFPGSAQRPRAEARGALEASRRQGPLQVHPQTRPGPRQDQPRPELLRRGHEVPEVQQDQQVHPQGFHL